MGQFQSHIGIFTHLLQMTEPGKWKQHLEVNEEKLNSIENVCKQL